MLMCVVTGIGLASSGCNGLFGLRKIDCRTGRVDGDIGLCARGI